MSDSVKLTSYSHGAGCGCKIAPGVLHEMLSCLSRKTPFPNLIVGNDTKDDAAVVDLGDGTGIVSTTDFFMPIVDDPHTFGRIAAANAISDIYAMGGKPLFALNIVAFPIQNLEKSILSDIMQGGADKANEAGIPIVGGHSVDDSEPKYGLVVTGEGKEKSMWTNTGAKPGDSLVLTKAIGTGIISTAIKKEKAQDSVIESAVESMKMLNKSAAETLQDFNPSAVTDVTGFGLIGHLIEMCKNSQVTAEINFSDIKFLPGAIELANDGIMPGGSKRNLEYSEKFVEFSNELSDLQKLLACDAQTSGGLLISLPDDEADEFIKALDSSSASKIGNIIDQGSNIISVNP